jgi:hypothetical protein
MYHCFRDGAAKVRLWHGSEVLEGLLLRRLWGEERKYFNRVKKDAMTA